MGLNSLLNILINMKLYIKDIKNNHINKHLLKEYIHNSIKKKIIISEQGILEINKDKMYLLKTIDVPCEIISIGSFSGLIDKSEFVKEEEWYQIPKDHILEETDIHTYQLRQNALVQFIIVEDKNIIKDYYFNIKENFEVLGIKDDILTLLSILKLC